MTKNIFFIVDTMKKKNPMHLVLAYVGFDCSKLPLCIFLFNLEFAYLPHPFVKYPPLKKKPQKLFWNIFLNFILQTL